MLLEIKSLKRLKVEKFRIKVNTEHFVQLAVSYWHPNGWAIRRICFSLPTVCCKLHELLILNLQQ